MRREVETLKAVWVHQVHDQNVQHPADFPVASSVGFLELWNTMSPIAPASTCARIPSTASISVPVCVSTRTTSTNRWRSASEEGAPLPVVDPQNASSKVRTFTMW